MWHHYLQNLFYKITLLWIGALFLSTSFAQTPAPLTQPLQSKNFNTNYPGLYKSFQDLIEIDQEKIKNKLAVLQKHVVNFAEIPDVNQIELDPDFLNSILLRSPGSYMELASRDKCSFFDLILTDLVLGIDGKIANIFIQYPDKENKLKNGVVFKKDFIEKVITVVCPDRKSIIAEFQIKTLDQTLRATKMDLPQNKSQCEGIFNEWYLNHKAIYYCQIYEVIKNGENAELEKNFQVATDMKAGDIQQKIAFASILRKKVSESQWEFLQAFCPNVDRPQKFCDTFFQTNFWSKITSKQKPFSYIEKVCQSTLGKDASSPVLTRECLRKINANSETCHYFTKEMPSLAPMPSCEHLSLALNNSNLQSDYDDCAGFGGNQSVYNASRIIRHFNPTNVPKIEGQCASMASGTVLEFLGKNDSEDTWNLQLCFDDKLLNREVCHPVIFGNYGDNKYSLSTVVRDILIKTKGADKSTTCKVINSDEYNPNLLDYKYGCFIELDPKQCNQSECTPKIFYNERVISN